MSNTTESNVEHFNKGFLGGAGAILGGAAVVVGLGALCIAFPPVGIACAHAAAVGGAVALGKATGS